VKLFHYYKPEASTEAESKTICFLKKTNLVGLFLLNTVIFIKIQTTQESLQKVVLQDVLLLVFPSK